MKKMNDDDLFELYLLLKEYFSGIDAITKEKILFRSCWDTLTEDISDRVLHIANN